MKNLIIIIFLFAAINVNAQSKKQLKAQIEALKADTAMLYKKNRELKEKLTLTETQLTYKKKQVGRWKSKKEYTETKLNREIDQLSIVLERRMEKLLEDKQDRKIVYFGEKDKFHGYDLDEGIGLGPEEYIAIPFGINRKLTNTLDLSEFSFKYPTQIYYKVEITKEGRITRLWCDENNSTIKNRILLRMIGREVQRQAQYSEAEISGFPSGSLRLVKFSTRIPASD